MNAAQVLDHFDRMSDAPDAIPRLRRFILNLAVRGKLVEQDPNDEPAAELLKRIQETKAGLLKEGRIKKSTLLESIRASAVLFEIPSSWEWVRLGQVSNLITKGSTPTSYGHSYVLSGINFIKVEAIRDSKLIPENVTSYITKETHEFLKRSQLASGDFLFSIAGSIGTCAIVTEALLPANTNQALAIIRGADAAFLIPFLQYSTRSSLLESALAKARGGAMNNISLEDVSNLLLALPPLAEQHRIVVKVDELMALCDRLEAAQTERESRRGKLAAASLHRLNNGADAEEFREHARFHLRHLPRLTTRPEHIQQLRQTILNLAVRGKLVPQDPNDEPATEFLGNRQLFTDSQNGPWKLPVGWAWSSFELIGETFGGGTPSKTNPDFWKGLIPWVSPKDMKVDLIRDTEDHISELAVEKSSTRLIPIGSLLMVVRGMILTHSFPTAISSVPLTINQDMKAITPFRPELIRMLLLITKGLKPEVLRLVLRSTHGTCKLLTDDLFSLPLPVPPIAEQYRIVAKVDELTALCDRLEGQLITTQSENRCLLEAIIHEALNSKSGLQA